MNVPSVRLEISVQKLLWFQATGMITNVAKVTTVLQDLPQVQSTHVQLVLETIIPVGKVKTTVTFVRLELSARKELV